jgi:hypothetical protein
MSTFKKLLKAYFDQHIIAFHSGAIGGLGRKGEDIARFRGSRTEKPPSKQNRAETADYNHGVGEATPVQA